MELNLNNKNILLLGEANFSFSLSLASYCYASFNESMNRIDGVDSDSGGDDRFNCRITATCYETKEEALRKYGSDLLESNTKALIDQFNCRVLFGIDACCLRKYFSSNENKFQRVIFMFPHVGGKSNLKKNRNLLNQFFNSVRDILSDEEETKVESESTKLNEPSVFVTLARGQGGTGFELDVDKRFNKDSWQILQLAQQNGFILTQCYELNQDKFTCYKSTGFRSQNKSFQTRAGLVHRFQLSLPINPSPLNHNLNSFKLNFLKKSKYFIENSLIMRNSSTEATSTLNLTTTPRVHPLIELCSSMAFYLKRKLNLNLNFLNDELRFNLIEDELTNHSYEIDSTLVASAMADADGTNLVDSTHLMNIPAEWHTSGRRVYLRSSMKQVLNAYFKAPSYDGSSLLNVLSGLCCPKQPLKLNNKINELNNFKFEVLFQLKYNDDQGDGSLTKINQFKNELINLIEAIASGGRATEDITELLNTQLDLNSNVLVDDIDQWRSKLIQFELNESNNELISIVDVSRLAMLLFGLDDKRLLYSDDERIFVRNQSLLSCDGTAELLRSSWCQWRIRPFSIETLKWSHDVSFWFDENLFDFNLFIETIQDVCLDLVRTVQLIDIYVEQQQEQQPARKALCFRLVYESCDRALGWQQTTQIQYSLRDKLQLLNGVCLR